MRAAAGGSRVLAYERDARVGWLWYVFGDVGEGILTWFGEVEFCCPPLIEAVRWFEAARAAAEGSKFELSDMDLPSGMECGRCVGELLFGVKPKVNFLVDCFRVGNLSLGACDGTGDAMPSWLLWKSGLDADGW